MERIGLFEAKTHLSQLVERVRRGESFVITKHGLAVARLVPRQGSTSKMTASQAAERIRAIQARSTLGNELSLRQLIDQGRRL